MQEETVFIATSDVAGIVRGRAVPASDRDNVLRRGVGWVPADLAVTAFGFISDNPFGATGDLRLMPDPSTRVSVPADGEIPGVEWYLADQTLPDGSPWECDPRSFARDAIVELADRHGLEALVSFEHEFMLLGQPETAPFSFRRFRSVEPFGTDLVRLLAAANLEPETWLPEYGRDQFEVTIAPATALVAADRAIVLKEMVRDLAGRRGHRATFAPLVDPAGSGNGVHVHVSLRDKETGRPVMFDERGPGRLSTVGHRFAAGILRHARALTAITAPSPVSMLRLVPHRWSAGGVFLAERNREALLRICPTSTVGGGLPESQLNLEYRAADATANPHLVIGALIRAGLAGLDAEDELPPVWPEDVTEEQLAGVEPLPASLDEALAALADDSVARRWFADDLLATYVAVKRAELAHLDGMDDVARCQAVSEVY